MFAFKMCPMVANVCIIIIAVLFAMIIINIVGAFVIIITCIVKKEMERVHDEIREQLPQRLIIPRCQLRILDTIGHGK